MVTTISEAAQVGLALALSDPELDAWAVEHQDFVSAMTAQLARHSPRLIAGEYEARLRWRLTAAMTLGEARARAALGIP
jgi:hypothetical protein